MLVIGVLLSPEPFSFVNWAHSRCCKFDFFCHSWLAKQSAYLAGHWIMLSPDMKKLVSNLPKTSNNGFTFSWELQWIWIFVGSHLLVDPQAFWRTKTWLERTTILTWLVCIFEKTCIWVDNKRCKRIYIIKNKQWKSWINLEKLFILLAILLLHFLFEKKTSWCKPIKLGRKWTSWPLATKLSYELDIIFFALCYFRFPLNSK